MYFPHPPPPPVPAAGFSLGLGAAASLRAGAAARRRGGGRWGRVAERSGVVAAGRLGIVSHFPLVVAVGFSSNEFVAVICPIRFRRRGRLSGQDRRPRPRGCFVCWRRRHVVVQRPAGGLAAALAAVGGRGVLQSEECAATNDSSSSGAGKKHSPQRQWRVELAK